MAYRATGKSHTISGFNIEEVEHVEETYKLVAVTNVDKEIVIAAGNNPAEVKAAENKVARNADLFTSIELRDADGILQVLWKPFWDWDHGKDEEVPLKTYYHVTPKRLLDDIQTEGLVPQVGPRSKELNEPERVWLFTSYDAMDNGLSNWLGEYLEDEGDLAVLEVKIPYGIATPTPQAEFEASAKLTIPADCIRVHQILLDEEPGAPAPSR